MKQILKNIYNGFRKNRIFSVINLTNLIVGYTTFILLGLFVHYESNWDRHNKNYDRIHRVQMEQFAGNKTTYAAPIPAAISRHVLPRLSQVEKTALIRHSMGEYLLVGEKMFHEKEGAYADQEIFNILDYNFKIGDVDKALLSPYSIVLSEELAKKLFLDGDAMGKQIILEKKHPLTVTGVYYDLPNSSTFRPSYMVSMKAYGTINNNPGFENHWRSHEFETYVLLKEKSSATAVNKKIRGAMKDHWDTHYPYLRPLSKLHISPLHGNDYYVVLWLFSFAAILVLVLSSVNYINLQTANATDRAKEIVIRKINGASKKTIKRQMLLESLFLSAFAAFVSLHVASAFEPVFETIIGQEIDFHWAESLSTILIILIATLLTGLLSGLLPAKIIASFNPVLVLKQKLFSSTKGKIGLKRILVTVQFSVSILLLLVSFIIYKQANYLITKDMGFDYQNLLFSSIKSNEYPDFEMLRQRLIKHQEIVEVSCSEDIPYVLPGGADINWEGSPPDEKITFTKNRVSHEYVDLFKLELLEGRNFSTKRALDTKACIINEAGKKALGFTDPVGKKIWDNKYTIIGVVKNYHQQSPHNEILPALLRLHNEHPYHEKIYTVRYAPGAKDEAEKIVKAEFEKLFPNDAFDFRNYEEIFLADEAYKIWCTFRNTFAFFAVLSIFIAAIGLLGLILFSTRKRSKEMSIRKVLGGSVKSIFSLMVSEIVILVFVAMAIATPFAYYVYKILPGVHKYPIGATEFLLALLVILLVVFLTIGYQVLKVARVNPVESLKYE